MHLISATHLLSYVVHLMMKSEELVERYTQYLDCTIKENNVDEFGYGFATRKLKVSWNQLLLLFVVKHSNHSSSCSFVQRLR